MVDKPLARAHHLRVTAIAFDTHSFVKRLTASGMPEAQAESLADEQAKLLTDRLATKQLGPAPIGLAGGYQSGGGSKNL
ncbi:MAG: hypothetical protein ACFB22_14875 [Rhodothalassiaceae bacterium]